MPQTACPMRMCAGLDGGGLGQLEHPRHLYRPGYRTVKVTGTWCTNAPAVPITPIVKAARGVDDVVRTRSVELPGVPTGFVLKVANAPAGRPVTESDTLPVKPPTDVTETV